MDNIKGLFSEGSKKYRFAYVSRTCHHVDLSSKVIINQYLTSDLSIVQKGIYYGLRDNDYNEVLEAAYDNFFKLEERGVLIYRRTNYEKKEQDRKRYEFGFLNINSKAKTPCQFNSVTQLFPGVYDATKNYVEHYLITNECKVDRLSYYQSISKIRNKILLIKDFGSRVFLTDNFGKTISRKYRFLLDDDYKYGEHAIAGLNERVYIIDVEGNEISLPYPYAKGFRYGLAPVCDGKRWGYMNTTGQLVISFLYAEAGLVNADGYAKVKEPGLFSASRLIRVRNIP